MEVSVLTKRRPGRRFFYMPPRGPPGTSEALPSKPRDDGNPPDRQRAGVPRSSDRGAIADTSAVGVGCSSSVAGPLGCKNAPPGMKRLSNENPVHRLIDRPIRSFGGRWMRRPEWEGWILHGSGRATCATTRHVVSKSGLTLDGPMYGVLFLLFRFFLSFFLFPPVSIQAPPSLSAHIYKFTRRFAARASFLGLVFVFWLPACPTTVS